MEALPEVETESGGGTLECGAVVGRQLRNSARMLPAVPPIPHLVTPTSAHVSP